MAWPVGLLIGHIEDAPASVIFRFVLTAARRPGRPARLRVSTFAVRDAVTFVLKGPSGAT